MPRIGHKFRGEHLCERCGAPERLHDTRNRRPYLRQYEREHPKPRSRDRIIGIDGEGQGRAPHLYNFLAASDEHGEHWSIGDDPNRQLSTEACLDFILSLPPKSLIFGYAFLYDLTKILTDLDDRSIYLLFHRKKRFKKFHEGRAIYRPVEWRGYQLEYMQRCFTVRRGDEQRTVWDVFAFFQSRFTQACALWKVADERALKEMEVMKEKRAIFDAQHFDAIKAYCRTECENLAQLGRKLLDAHVEAGFPLRSYFGAGSTASALMNKHDVKQYIADIPDEMKEAVACAFFGGRFENSVLGPVNRPVWNADIASAYPYAATLLTCLIHGSWKYCRNTRGLETALEKNPYVLINWQLPETDSNLPWGPLPIRKADGTIAFPLAARSGWTWRNEFIAARHLRPDIRVLGHWRYTADCGCRPFSFLPAAYLERLRIGKDGAGIVIKLGSNSVYGKLVQSVGFNPPFQSFVLGGNITSTCRAQLLEGMALAPSLDRVLMLATDGLWTDCPIDLPLPKDTGTKNPYGKPELGGWEVKAYPRGVFAARPGIYWPMDPTEEDLEKVRARGLGRRVLYEAHKELVRAYDEGEPHATIKGGARFIGAKTGVHWSAKEGAIRSPNYGEWVDWPINVSFDPRPKRERVNADGTLKCWDYFDAPSFPYENAIKSEEDQLLMLASLIADEQPTGEFVEV